MKTRVLSLLLALALLLPCLAACDSAKTPSPADGGTASVKPAQNTEDEESPAGTEPDYSWFEMPEETDSLVLCSTFPLTDHLTKAVEIFERLYPNVSVDWRKLGPEEYETQMRTEIPAGKGPDLFYSDRSILPDVYKTMSAGLFADLNPYLYADGEIDPDDYIRGIFDAGLLHGKRGLIPVSHDMTILATTEELLGEIGVTSDDLSGYDGFIDACTQFHALHPDGCIIPDLGPDETTGLTFSGLYSFSGFRMIDYENSAVSVSEEPFRKMVDLCRLFAGNDPNKMDYTDGAYISTGAVLKRESMFSNFATSPLLMNVYQYGVESQGEKAVFLTPPSSEGGKATEIETYGAILASSPNRLNAWRLLKILLSDEIQGDYQTFSIVSPIRLSAIPLYLSEYDVMNTIPGLETLYKDFDRGTIRAPVLYRYVHEEMMPYIEGKKSFEDCYKKLLNTLELYKDE